MIVEFGFGKGTQNVDIPDENLQDILMSNPLEHERTGPDAVEYALDNPIGSGKLEDIVKPGQKIAIITSDISRPIPSFDVIPSILKRLFKAGCAPEDIKVVFALGSHRHHTEDEKKHLVGEWVYEQVECVDSEPEDCIHMGDTSRGTPVDITRSVAEADFRIGVGNIEFHYFAGYSGGAKALMPGVSTPNAIQSNHRMMVDENACAGKLEGNPVRADIEESETFCHLSFIVNVVLDEHKHIVYGVAGDVTEAHRVGCRYLDQMYRKPIKNRADIVIVSQGGAPKDANLYQTQKALDNSKHAVKDGGTIILIGACNEGLGSKVFEEWLVSAPTAESMITRVNEHFQLGGHKAAAIAMVLQHAKICLVSEMDDDFVRSIFLEPVHSAQEAFDEAMSRYGKEASVICMPFGGATLPMPPENS